MHHNQLRFWQTLENLPNRDPRRLSPRVCRLLQRLFERWKSKPVWPPLDALGHLFDRYNGSEREAITALPVAERKGLAVKESLRFLTNRNVAKRCGTMEIHTDELIVGTPPPFSVGQGKELMRYLTEDEALQFELLYLNEWSPFGHVVPLYSKLLDKGMVGIIRECEQQMAICKEPSKISFYKAAISAMEGVIEFATAYANLAKTMSLDYNDEPSGHLKGVAQRLAQVPANPPRDFLEAVQSFYIVHCALHFTGEITSIGRLDQFLFPWYRRDIERGALTQDQAQEIIDCLWIKLDEKVVLNRRHLEDRFTSSDGALLGSGTASNFDQGALANQWMQQVTIGGVIAENEGEARDATNDLTYLCLNAAERLPLNSPTLDLRVHKNTPDEVLKIAAKALLSGGAHPVLLNDDRLIPALMHQTGGKVELKSARNYACDGCYETLFAGETEFSFGFVPALDVLEKALNSGAGLGLAGGTYLRGLKGSWRSPEASSVKSFSDFWFIMCRHIDIGCHRFIHGILNAYGCKENVSPSPLLSALLEGCVESGRDISAGGARYHLFSPLMTGISTAVDSLYVIKRLVFEKRLFSLEELVACLRTNWGKSEELIGLAISPGRAQEIRELCIAQPKFGTGVTEVDELAWQLIEEFSRRIFTAKSHRIHAAKWEMLQERFGLPGRPFEILLAPGVGTFEQYVFGGGFAGATPDGRYAFDPIASDLSPSPLHSDQEPDNQIRKSLLDALKSYAHPSLDALCDGAPADLNIAEDFPIERLVDALRRFANGDGGNVLTITTCSPETFKRAAQFPDEYDLLRVRMGGWTEFFITLFPAHKQQHRRRRLFGH